MSDLIWLVDPANSGFMGGKEIPDILGFDGKRAGWRNPITEPHVPRGEPLQPSHPTIVGYATEMLHTRSTVIGVAHLVTGEILIVCWLIRVASTILSYTPLFTFSLEGRKGPTLFKGIAIFPFLDPTHQYHYQTIPKFHYLPLHPVYNSNKYSR